MGSELDAKGESASHLPDASKSSRIENDPDQDDGFGKKLNDLSYAELLDNAHWAHRLIDACWDGEFDCATPDCGRQTSNGRCRDCMHGKSPAQRAEYAESLLCAMAFDHQRIMLGPTFWYCDRESRDGPCMFCEAYR